VKAVQDAVQDGGDQYRHDPDEDEAAEQSVKGSEDLRPIVGEFSDWTHASEDHAGIQERIDPCETSKVTITEHTDTDSKHHHAAGDREAARHSPQEKREGQQGFFPMFKHMPANREAGKKFPAIRLLGSRTDDDFNPTRRLAMQMRSTRSRFLRRFAFAEKLEDLGLAVARLGMTAKLCHRSRDGFRR
jgi:hypothetical protein